MHELAQKLCQIIRGKELFHPGDRVGVAVSGGPDSVALLRLLLELRKELGIVLSVVHLNHKLRGAEAEADAEFVCGLAREHKLTLHSTVADVGQHAAAAGISIETAARELRYRFFRDVLGEHMRVVEPQGLKPREFENVSGTAEAVPSPISNSHPSSSVHIPGPVLNKIATGHTLDDQAETVLMRIIRGTGMRGLRSIQPRMPVETEHGTNEIIRPLLEVRRQELLSYLRDVGQTWREDATNRDLKFTRNRVRQLLLPLLEREFNAAIAERLAELAEIARAEEDFWENETSGWIGTGIHWLEPESEAQLVQLMPAPGAAGVQPPDQKQGPVSALVDLAWLLSEPLAVQRRIIRAVADQASLALDFQQVENVLKFAAEEESNNKELVLAAGWKVRCGDEALEFVSSQALGPEPANPDYELRLAVPGEVTITQAGSRVQAINVETANHPPGSDPDHLYDPSLLAKELTVRNWRPGDRFWPAHTKAPKKMKELLQEKHISRQERRVWPVILSGEDVIWTRGFPGKAKMRPRGTKAVLLRELPINHSSR